jgi:hypothetical protein
VKCGAEPCPVEISGQLLPDGSKVMSEESSCSRVLKPLITQSQTPGGVGFAANLRAHRARDFSRAARELAALDGVLRLRQTEFN